MKKLIALVVLLAALAAGASQAYGWYGYQVTTPVSRSRDPVRFVIAPGEGVAEVGQALEAKGLIRSSLVFQVYLRLNGLRSSIQAGSYVLDKNMSMEKIASALQHGRSPEVSITIPEGFTVARIAALVQQQGLSSSASYVAAEKDPSWRARYRFLAALPSGRDLEGYLFPDTYLLNQGAPASDLVRRQLDEFSAVFDSQLVSQAARPVPGVRGPQTVDQIVILASIVQREVSKPSDMRGVCGVFYNRLSLGMRLQADSTVLYAEGVWKKQVLDADLRYPSPYNTYLNAGLPPGPISNPGREAIMACVDPAASSYLYYFDDPQGVTHFDATLAQFDADKARYGVAGG